MKKLTFRKTQETATQARASFQHTNNVTRDAMSHLIDFDVEFRKYSYKPLAPDEMAKLLQQQQQQARGPKVTTDEMLSLIKQFNARSRVKVSEECIQEMLQRCRDGQYWRRASDGKNKGC